MSVARQQGTTLVVGLILLAVVTLLGLAGATGARVELQLALNEQFRENAATAASAGIEYAISRIVTAVPASFSAPMPDSTDRFETATRFLGYETALPQEAGAQLAGAHFEITSTGYSARNARDTQRAFVMLVVAAPESAAASACAPEVAEARCWQLGELARLSWQRLPLP